MLEREVKNLNKKILAAILALSLAVVITVAAFAPALAHNDRDDQGKVPPAPVPGVEYVYGTSGYVILNLPQGALYNKTNLQLGFMDVDKRSTKGAEDTLTVRIWVPSTSRFGAIVMIDDNPIAIDSLKKMYAGIPVLLPILVGDTDLEVWREHDVTIVNLTKPVDIKFGSPAPQIYKDLNFTLPPMTLRFIKTGEVYENSESNATYPSGWTGSTTSHYAPAWASVVIPSWTGSTQIPTAGVLNVKFKLVATPPPAP
jgi:hypothetical protein